MSALEKEINSILASSTFFQSNLLSILDKTNDAYRHITAKGKLQRLPIDSETDKEILQKCLYEATNRLIIDNVRESLAKDDASYSKQPLLLAHPSGVKSVYKNARLDQLQKETIEEFMKDDIAVVDHFLDVDTEGLFKKLELMEMEGRFTIQR